MLSGTVDALERLFMKQAGQTMTLCHLFHGFHHQLIVIRRQIGFCVNRSQLVLRRSHLVMLGLGRYAQLPQLFIKLLHICADALPDHPVIMVIHFLSLRRHGTKQSSSGVNQIFSLQILLPIHKEIFLLRPYRRHHPFYRRIAEQMKNPNRLFVNSLHGTQKRSFLIQRLAPVRTERCRNAERHTNGVLLQKGRRGAVPGGIASGLKRGSQASGREGGAICFTLNQFLSGQIHNHLS